MLTLGVINIDLIDNALDDIQNSLVGSGRLDNIEDHHIDMAIRAWILRNGSKIPMEPWDEQTMYHFFVSRFRNRVQAGKLHGSTL